MLHEAQRTCAPSAFKVSINTAVWMVMCREPVMRAPRSGICAANSCRMAMRPGISVSAILISLRPHSASPKSLTRKSLGCLIAAFIDMLRKRRASCSACGFEFGGESAGLVGALPGEFRFLTAEMPVGGGFLIDRPRQIEHFAQAERREIEVRAHQLGQARIGQFTGAESLDHDGGGLGHSDGVGDLHFAAIGKP